MALKINLKPGDKLFMGTSKVQVAGEGYATIIIEGDLPVLREGDAIAMQAARTPGQRFRYAIQQAYLSRERQFLDIARDLCDEMGQDREAAMACIALFEGGQAFKAVRAAMALDEHSGASSH